MLSDELCEVGSPPHTRERHCKVHEILAVVRITPAYAGKTAFVHNIRIAKQDHPRIRGKDSHVTLNVAVPSGSPPHTRERLRCSKEHCQQHRITPAYAGKTHSLFQHFLNNQDHPRIRGKDIVIIVWE